MRSSKLIIYCGLIISCYVNCVYGLQKHKEGTEFWMKSGQDNLQRILALKNYSAPKARNVIIFIGDGMGMTTITASRIYKGQRKATGGTRGNGEEYSLVWDRFPNVALAKTYNVDKQVPDSAGTATAIFSGVKTRYSMLGLDATSQTSKFEKEEFNISELGSIMDWAQDVNKRTGFVTTTRVTHATPAALYANINDRDWECDGKVPSEYKKDVKDIARQLVEENPGRKFNVILAGGSDMMGSTDSALTSEPECPRTDNRNLIKDWLVSRREFGASGIFVNNTRGLRNVPVESLNYLMGIFANDHMPYNMERDKEDSGTPSLSLMTKQAIGILSRSDGEGFVLMVEGGRIDHGHHDNYAQLALDEASEFDEAIRTALNLINLEETLVIVTADHSHAFTINGYPERGNDILGVTRDEDTNEPYETLTYANGPGYKYHRINNTGNETWRDVSLDQNRNDTFYRHLATFYLEDETHGGEDVPVYATGPCSHLIRGVFEQNYIGHVISFAACIGPSAELNPACKLKCTIIKGKEICRNSSNIIKYSKLSLYICIFIFHKFISF